jgi:proprotein convertase subtilisin/kexin type 5
MYPDSTNSCQFCVTPCKACTSATACLSCLAGRFFYQTNCLLSCPSNITVANISTDACDPCATICLTCMGATTNCSSCDVGTALYQGNCVTVCPDPLVNKTGVCQSCDSPCLTCSQVSTNCTSCISTSITPHYLNNQCMDACPSTYYSETATSPCLPCSSLGINCVLCRNATSCIICDPDFIFFPSNASCLNYIPIGYANVSGTAQPCEGDCATCQSLTTNCTSCKSLNLLGNQCTATCPSNFAPVFGVCTLCQSPCVTCSQTTTQCTSCISTATPQVYLSGSSCVQSCPTSTYANSTLQQCVACESPCSTCNSKTICQSCVSGYNLYLSSCLNGFCPGGYTPVASQCVLCSSPCLTCTTSPSTCSSCRHGLSPELYLINVTCVQANQCPSGTYPDVSSNLCAACQPPCSTCTSLTVCLSCTTGYNLDGTLCKSNCLDGFMPINAICTACASPCSTCAGSLSTCLSCNLSANGSSLYLSGLRCVATCPNSTYSNDSNFHCSPCQSPCSYCNSLSSCTMCMGGFFFYSNYCYASCPLGYVGIALNCEKCSIGCLTC